LKFCKANGSIVCRELLGLKKDFYGQEYGKQLRIALVRMATRIMEEYIRENIIIVHNGFA
jgi:hypothetical protein